MTIERSKLARKLKTRFASKQSVLKRYPAEMGDGRGNLEVDNMDGFIYVRINDKVVPVFNNRVANQAGTAVWVGYAPENETLLQVLSTRSDSPTGAETGYVGFAPAKRYEWHAPRGGQDPLAVHLRAITPLKLSVSDTVPTPGELLVNLYRGFVYSGARYYAIQRQDIDLSAHVPTTAGKAAFVMVTISNTGTIVQTKGTEVDIDALAITDIPEIPASTVFVCGAVRVYYGQEKIKEGRTNTDFVDLRFTSAYGFDTSGAFLLDPDPLMAADSDEVAPTQAAVIDYVAAEIPAQGADYFVRKWLKLTDPTVDDDDTEGYLVTDEWFVTSTQRLYKCKDNATGAAVWTLDGIGGADLQWKIDGPLAVADPCDVPILITKPTTLTALYIYGEDLGSAGSTTVDIDLNGGGTILSAPISLAYNDANGWAMVVPVTVDLVEGDILTPSTTGVATGAAGLRIILQAESEAGGGAYFNLTLEEKSAGVSVSNVGMIVVPDDSLVNNGGGEVEISFPLVLLDVQSASNSASLDFTDFGADDYHAYMFVLYSLIPATNSVALYVRFSTDGGGTYDSTNLYHVSNFRMTNAASASEGQAPGSPTSQIAIPVAGGISNDANYGFCGKLMLSNKDTALYKRLQGEVSAYTTTPSMVNIVVSGAYKNATVVDGVRFVMSSGNIASGKIAMYGIRGSL